jgi:hypothetical protein
MASKNAEEDAATPGQVLAALEKWQGWVVLVVGGITALVVGWNAKASTDELEELEQKLNEQAKQSSELVGRLDSLKTLDAKIQHLSLRIDNLFVRPLAAQTVSVAAPDGKPKEGK